LAAPPSEEAKKTEPILNKNLFGSLVQSEAIPGASVTRPGPVPGGAPIKPAAAANDIFSGPLSHSVHAPLEKPSVEKSSVLHDERLAKTFSAFPSYRQKLESLCLEMERASTSNVVQFITAGLEDLGYGRDNLRPSQPNDNLNLRKLDWLNTKIKDVQKELMEFSRIFKDKSLKTDRVIEQNVKNLTTRFEIFSNMLKNTSVGTSYDFLVKIYPPD
jgi:hypothetical protein